VAERRRAGRAAADLQFKLEPIVRQAHFRALQNVDAARELQRRFLRGRARGGEAPGLEPRSRRTLGEPGLG